MPADSIEVLCGNCRAHIDEDPGLPADRRKPCPSCGSLSRHINQAMSDTVTLHSKVNMKGKRPSMKRPFIEQTVGDDLHRKTGQWMKLHRVIDRLRNRGRHLRGDSTASFRARIWAPGSGVVDAGHD